MAVSKKPFIFLTFFIITFNVANFSNAFDNNIKRQYVLDANIDDIMQTIRDYDQYPKLFDSIKHVNVLSFNNSRDVVYFDIKVLRKKFEALLEFKRYENYGRTSYRIRCNSIKLNNMDYLDGTLHISKVSKNKTKIRIEANIKPSVFVPEFMLKNIMNRSINEAIKNLEKLANEK